MKNVLGLRCVDCGKQVPAVPGTYTCPTCGKKGGIMDVEYDYKVINQLTSREQLSQSKDYSIFRYMPFLPIYPDSARPHLRVGWSPLYKPEGLGKSLGMSNLYVKDDGQNPTASLKDRASIIAVIKAVEEKAPTVAASSTGNAASSLAGSAAAMGIKSVIFVPSRAPQGKIAQLLIFGATVISVQGSYEDTFRLSAEAIDRFGWYNRNAAINPYLVEGKKTVALEIAEQLNWEVPDWVVLSVGDGCTIAGVWKGFKDLYNAGWIDRLPKIAGVQSTGCCPLVDAFLEDRPWVPKEENTIADSIAVGVPRNPDKALNAVRQSGGTMVAVSDEAILEAMRELGRTSGIFGEPAGVTGTAGLKVLLEKGVIGADEKVVSIVTGNGLKDVANAIKAVGEPIKVEPSLNELLVKLEGKI
ncbi:threonine synthase [Desulfosporosinus sp.]|uniref:threonine synthase n=1 Tax=Desulfosporosinus sp. TaxID=157907 RepID=UPI000E918557|nr:threonine synthase [Desulfosporosinus sp.]MBC2722788.1 threonine synthase [Desulfosporosinus sp.]MBC2727010.1 threonine synthase [Desulfosporosinus sp.]HBV88331.1 threonine synthase [Desulfosporosinus sp.]